MPPIASRLATERGWVDPLALPDYMDPAAVAGNASEEAKRLTLHTLGAYGVGAPDSFAYAAGRRIRIVRMDVHRRGDKTEVVVISEAQVCKGAPVLVLDAERWTRGADSGGKRCSTARAPCMEVVCATSSTSASALSLPSLCLMCSPPSRLHTRSCASFPLLAQGVLQNTNGVGVTSALNVLFHAPASL